MTGGQINLRPHMVALVVLAILLATAHAAFARPATNEDLTVVSSIVLGEDTFTMTAWNVSLDSVDVSLAPPGTVSAVSVDTGAFDDLWTIDDLAPGAAGTMVGIIES